jgi:membrane protease YdiL (CAAX protease family)
VVLSFVVFLPAVLLGVDIQSIDSIPAQILGFIAYTGSVYAARRWLDKLSFESLGLKVNLQALRDVLIGIGISALQMGSIYLVMLRLGWLAFEGFAWQFDPINTVITSTLTLFVVFLFVGWNEEIFSRGYHLQTITSGLNLFWGVVISSVIFGWLHLGNPNSNWIAVAGIFFAGIYLAYGYTRTKQLWLSIGLHIGWNFFEGVIFGFPVSGLDMYPLLRINVTGPVLWTGGAFGPEAGLIVLPSLIIGGLLIYLYTKNRDGNI